MTIIETIKNELKDYIEKIVIENKEAIGDFLKENEEALCKIIIGISNISNLKIKKRND